MGTFASYLAKNYNTKTQELNFFGKTLTLGESKKEGENDEKKEENKSHHEESKEDDD
jgi:hypothetical protein